MAYAYYTEISVKATGVSADEVNFPVALHITNLRFATVANGGHVQNTDASGGASGAMTVPADFVVAANNDGSTPYDFEVEYYDATIGELTLHIKVPSLSSSINTTFYLVYGDASITTTQEDVNGVWDADYVLVHHLAGSSAAECDDSTANGHDINAEYGDPTYQQSGQIGKSILFDGSGDYLEIGDHADLDITGAITIEMLINLVSWGANDTANAWDGFVQKGEGSAYAVRRYNVNSQFAFSTWGLTNVDMASETHSLTDVWYHVVAIYNGSNKYIYVNGALDASVGATGSMSTNANALRIAKGWHGSYAREANAYIDEIRISDVARDSDYVTTTYNNSDDPTDDGAFWTALGAEVLISELSWVKLSWTDNSDNESGFSIERSATSATAGFAEVNTVEAGVTTYTDTELAPDTYWYRIRSYDAAGRYSDYSNVVEVTVT